MMSNLTALSLKDETCQFWTAFDRHQLFMNDISLKLKYIDRQTNAGKICIHCRYHRILGYTGMENFAKEHK